jgi:hypothetical protein
MKMKKRIRLAGRSNTKPATNSHLKRGAIRGFLAIMRSRGYFDVKRWNKSDFTYAFDTASIIEFCSVDSPDKVRGGEAQRDLRH